MFIFFPILFFLSCIIIFKKTYQCQWRVAVLNSSIVTVSIVVLLTELLSLFQSFSFYPLVFCWVVLSVGGAFWAWKLFPIQCSFNFRKFLLSEKIFLGIIVCVSLINLITALQGVPNTWDSMTYHLSRVEHWIQNKTVAYYPTHIIRQLYITPLAEYLIAQLRILGGGTSSPTLIQWFAMLGSLSGISLIAEQLGASRKGQLMAAVLVSTIPMGILQSVSTQTDYVCAYWLVCVAFFLIELQTNQQLVYKIAAALSFGLAILTKGNSYIYIVPFLIIYLFIQKRSFCQKITLFLIMVLVAVMLNLGQYWRNYQTFGSAAWTSVPLTNASFGPQVLLVNLLRNVGIHLGTPFRNINETLTQALTNTAKAAHADINNPSASFSSEPFNVGFTSVDEDYAGNFIHLFFFFIVFLILWIVPFQNKAARVYSIAVVLGLLLFCLIVRYQPWHSRFHLPLFVLFCPVAGLIMDKLFNKLVAVIIAIIFFVFAWPWMFLNHQHPWMGQSSIWHVPPQAQYFYKKSDQVFYYAISSFYLKATNCKEVGLVIGEDAWEYPWWAYLTGSGIRLEHVLVDNQSSRLRYPLGEFQPCAIITSEEPKQSLSLGNSQYLPVLNPKFLEKDIVIYLKQS